MAKWLILGSGGQLGHDLLEVLADEDEEVVGLDLPDVDIADSSSLAEVLSAHEPDVVVNAAAYTAVDDAETNEELAAQINAKGPELVAQACRAHPGTKLVHISTDYVFDGQAESPYSEDAPTGPNSAYGRTKLAGEQAVLAELPDSSYVVRTAWLYGANGANFVKTMLRLEADLPGVRVVDDQSGQPTWSHDLAEQIVSLVQSDAPPGIYHGTSSGQTSWYEFTCEIYRLIDADPERVTPTTTDAFPRPAPRPAYSVLGHGRWDEVGLDPIRPWQEALAEALPILRATSIDRQQEDG